VFWPPLAARERIGYRPFRLSEYKIVAGWVTLPTHMILRRLLLAPLAIAICVGLLPRARGQEVDAPATVRSLCDALLAAMKQGSALNFAARRQLLDPVIRRDLDLAFMTRIVVGPTWRGLPPTDRQQLVDAFSDFSIATYTERFKSYSGERFDVDPSPAPQPSGDCIVHTKLFTGSPEPVQLDYLLRRSGDQWRIIDVYLNGTISEMAARRSEYSATLREGGAAALVDLLRKKVVELGG
jgi:phospholipid transport system substrate-binding protein